MMGNRLWTKVGLPLMNRSRDRAVMNTCFHIDIQQIHRRPDWSYYTLVIIRRVLQILDKIGFYFHLVSQDNALFKTAECVL